MDLPDALEAYAAQLREKRALAQEKSALEAKAIADAPKVEFAKQVERAKDALSIQEFAACLTRPTPGTVAVSRDLEAKGWTCGKRVLVEGYGLLVVNDRMHKRKRNQLDVFFGSTERALAFGIQPGRQAALVEM